MRHMLNTLELPACRDLIISVLQGLLWGLAYRMSPEMLIKLMIDDWDHHGSPLKSCLLLLPKFKRPEGQWTTWQESHPECLICEAPAVRLTAPFEKHSLILK